jgi:protein SCO1/2
LTGLTLLAAASAPAHEGHRAAAVASDTNAASKTRVRLADVELTDQSRRRGLLARDIVGGRIVIANFVYTTCSSVCPLISVVFNQVQQQLPAELARDTVLLSISVDPLNDTPEQLQAAAQQYGSGDGWRWLTGRVNDIESVLKGFGAYSVRAQDHLPMVVIGDPSTNTWYRFTDMPASRSLVDLARQLRQQRQQKKS